MRCGKGGAGAAIIFWQMPDLRGYEDVCLEAGPIDGPELYRPELLVQCYECKSNPHFSATVHGVATRHSTVLLVCTVRATLFPLLIGVFKRHPGSQKR